MPSALLRLRTALQYFDQQPWEAMSDSSTKLLATVAVWAGTACIFTFGLCQMNWRGDDSMFLFFILTIAVSASAAWSTGAIWRGDSSCGGGQSPPRPPSG
jgi:hypothetical protein